VKEDEVQADGRLMNLFLIFLLQVVEKKDIAYYDGKDADPKKHKLDLYMPEGAKDVPVVMWIHGGAWKSGDRATYASLGRRFAEHGIGCAAISYRLSPGVKHPEHVKDCARAFAWLYKNVKAHGGSPDRLFVCGHSAGGHLTALLSLHRTYLKEVGVPEGAIKGAIPMSGVYTIFPSERIKMFMDAFGNDPETCKEASPTTHVQNATMPMLVVTETIDPWGFVRWNLAQLVKAVKTAEVNTVTFVDAKDRDHMTIVTKMMGDKDDPQLTLIVEFIQKHK
jgi:dipeptidyl aminopeptidase/acylaminoacyl peptidase